MIDPYVDCIPSRIPLAREDPDYWRKAYEKNPPPLRPFVGVDGEGGNVGPGDHRYFLLRAGDRDIRMEGGLTSAECLYFIASLPHGPIYVSYFFDYDVTMILRDLPPERLHRLVQRELRVGGNGNVLPLDYGPFRIEWIPKREFRVKYLDEPSVTINDVGTMFGKSFLDTITRWDIGDPTFREFIRKGKEQRASFGPLTSGISMYNQIEVDMLAKLMETVRASLVPHNLQPTRWQGPGSLAASWHRRNRTPLLKDMPVPLEVVEVAKSAYFGGRFEIGCVGSTPPVTHYDIRSAYAWALTRLPCLLHGGWSYNRGMSGGQFSLHHVDFRPNRTHKDDRYFRTPVRASSGSIYYPASGTGWYWGADIMDWSNYANTRQIVNITESWQFSANCDCKPYAWVEDTYRQRRALGADERGAIVKRGLTAVYGKHAQIVGKPRYQNLLIAGMVTALVRQRIFDAIEPVLNDVYMIATDGFAMRGEHPTIQPTDGLGGWEVKDVPSGLFLIQSGLYFLGDSDNPKTRGVPRSAIVAHRKDFERAFAEMTQSKCITDGEVKVPLTVFIGLKDAVKRDRLDLAGQWVDVEYPIRFDWRHKRKLVVNQLVDGMLITHPYESPEDYGEAQALESAPYNPLDNLEDRMDYDSQTQPDWVEYLLEGVTL